MSTLSDTSERRADPLGAILGRFLPAALGLMLWTPLGLLILARLASLPALQSCHWLKEPSFQRLTIPLAAIAYALVIRAAFDRQTTVMYMLKMLLFPVYLLWESISVVYSLHTMLRKARTVLSNFMVGALLLVLNPALLVLAVGAENSTMAMAYTLVGISVGTLSVAWLYLWTFRPLGFLGTLARFFEKYLEDHANRPAGEQALLLQSDSGTAEKRREAIQTALRPAETLLNIVQRTDISGVLVNTFVLLYSIVGAEVCLVFAVLYRLMSRFSPSILVAEETASLLPFVIFSLRTMLLNDYAGVTVHSELAHWVILWQSVLGVALVVVLVMSFQTLSTQEGTAAQQDFVQRITQGIENLKGTLPGADL